MATKKPKRPPATPAKYIRSIVYGGLDGTITTFAIVAGVSGAALSSSIILILGFANLIADGISMAAGDYLSTKSKTEYREAEKKYEKWEVKSRPKTEERGIISWFTRRGMTKKDATTVAKTISKYEKPMIDVTLAVEHGIIGGEESPTKNALVTFSSFIFFGIVPLLTYLFAPYYVMLQVNTFFVASILTAITLFVLGATKARITKKSWIFSGLEMLIIGGIAAGAAYLIGFGISQIV